MKIDLLLHPSIKCWEVPFRIEDISGTHTKRVEDGNKSVKGLAVGKVLIKGLREMMKNE